MMNKRGHDDYFIRYYRPWLWTSTENHFGRKMNSSDMFIPKGLSSAIFTSPKAMESNLSPFKRRRGTNEMIERLPRHSAERTPHGVGVSVGVRRWLKTKSNLTLKSNLGTMGRAGGNKGRPRGPLETREGRVPPVGSHEPIGENGLGLDFHDDRGSLGGDGTGNDTKRVAIKLLHPTVDMDEAREYHSYLHQFDKSRLGSTSAKDEIYETDLRTYKRSAALSSSFVSDHHQAAIIEVDEKNRLLYEESVLCASMSDLIWP